MPPERGSEAYTRNNAGRFAESAEFFDSLASRDVNEPSALAEAFANQGLQQSNLGNFAAAERLIARAEAASPRSDGVLQRLIRNYRAINQLNQHRHDAAIAALAVAVAPVAEIGESEEIRRGLITPPLSWRSTAKARPGRKWRRSAANLTPAERAAILDAQATELRGIALAPTRQAGRSGGGAGRRAHQTSSRCAKAASCRRAGC